MNFKSILSKIRPNFYGLIAVCVLSFLFIFYHYDAVVVNPNKYLFSTIVDGLANYYSTAYHIKHDSGFQQFEGMNYPFGETLSYVDAQPLLANSLKVIAYFVPSISDYTVGIMNSLMLFSIIACAALLFGILRLYKVPLLFAIFGSVAITVLSSHVLLWSVGHYALSYQWVFPLVWFLCIYQSHKNKNLVLYSIFIGLAVFVMLRLHVYIGLTGVFFASLFYLQRFLLLKQYKKIAAYMPFLFIMILPILTQLLIMSITNQHERASMGGTTEHRAAFWNLFIPNYSITRRYFEQIIDLSPQGTYTWSFIGTYIGIPSILVIVAVFVYFIISLQNNVVEKYKQVFPASFTISLIASIIILLYATGIYHKTIGINYVIDSISFARQLVSIGRFAWPFYFVITVCCFVFVIGVVKKKLIRNIILSIIIIVFFIEGNGYHTHMSKKVSVDENILHKDYLPIEFYTVIVSKRIDFSKYQAIIAIPFNYIYFCQFQKTGTNQSTNNSMILSFHSGLPMLNTMLSRPSSKESLTMSSIFYGNKEAYIEHLKSDKPFLVMCNKDSIPPDERKFIYSSTLIYKNNELSFYELDINKLADY